MANGKVSSITCDAKKEVLPIETNYIGEGDLIKFMMKKRGLVPSGPLLLKTFYKNLDTNKRPDQISLLDAFQKKSIDFTIRRNKKFNENLEANENKLINAVHSECTRIKDQIQFGDSEEALKMIKAFEKF